MKSLSLGEKILKLHTDSSVKNMQDIEERVKEISNSEGKQRNSFVSSD